jgi:hypothetical protein
LCLGIILLTWLKFIPMCGRKVTRLSSCWSDLLLQWIEGQMNVSWAVSVLLQQGHGELYSHFPLATPVINTYVVNWYPPVQLLFFDCLVLKKKALWSFKTLVTIYQLMWCNIPKDLNLQQHFCENRKSNSCLIQTCYLFMTDVFLFHSAPQIYEMETTLLYKLRINKPTFLNLISFFVKY